jgi:DNA-binding PadR family transcriptional regulator
MNPTFWQFFQHDRRGSHRGDGAFAAGRGGPHGRGPGGGPFGGGRFGGGGFPPFGGGFFRRGGRARRGDVRAAILVLLLEEPRNGYQLMQEIEQRSEGTWRPSPGSMYPALQQLEDEGLVSVETASGGRTFHLTEKGKKQATAQQKEPAPWSAPSEGGREAAVELAMLFKQVSLAAMQVVQAGNDAQVAEARKVLVEARRALYRILAEDEAEDEE